MLLDQASALRTLVMQTTIEGARTVAITSGKGGVGKSNVAVNLAACLAQLGRSVVILDADLGTANADILCDLKYHYTLAHVVAGRKRVSDIVVDAPGGFRIVPGASGLAQMAALGSYDRERVLEQMAELERDCDLILIDTGAGVGPNVMGFLAGSDEQLVVTTPEPTAIADAYAVIKAMARQEMDLDAALLVNMARDEREALGVYQRVRDVSAQFLGMTPRYAGHILHDPTVSAAVRSRKPFLLHSPKCAASKSIRRVAQRLSEDFVQTRRGGLLQRMAAWIGG